MGKWPDERTRRYESLLATRDIVEHVMEENKRAFFSLREELQILNDGIAAILQEQPDEAKAAEQEGGRDG